MKVYIVMLYDHEEFKVGPVFSHEEDAIKAVGSDQFDYYEIRDVCDLPDCADWKKLMEQNREKAK